MDFNKSFWDVLDSQVGAGTVYSSVMVYNELTVEDNKLSEWVKNRRSTGLFVNPSEGVQTLFRGVADYVKSTYPSYNADRFLGGADPWVIAHAIEDGSTVVTQEVLVQADSKKVKIPNVCKKFSVEWANTYNMIRSLAVTL